MKKGLILATLSLLLVVGFSSMLTVKADDTIELYPYDKEECLLALDTCKNTKVGDSHWDLLYNGYNYNVTRGNAIYAVDFEDTNSDGVYDATEVPGTNWSSFGGIIINDSMSEIVMDTATNRGDFVGGLQRVWLYFDENGDAVMYEDHVINQYFVFNQGTVEAPVWRFATEAEQTALADAETAVDDATVAHTNLLADVNATQQQIDDAAAAIVTAQAALDAIAETTQESFIRIKMDDTTDLGYIIELLPYLGWNKTGVDTETAPVEDWSDILDGDPANVVLPAGWTAFYIGYLDRNGSNAKTLDMIGAFVEAMTSGTADAMAYSYEAQPAWFNGLNDLDDDPATAGINIVVDYNGTFNMPTEISAEWLNMFDETGTIINSVEKLDITVDIADETGVLETLTYTWNATSEEYDLSAEQTVIDSSVFGSGYTATFTTTTPEGEDTVKELDIVIGVMPPRFEGIMDRYVKEDVYVNLLEGITADDGYGNDVTNTIEVTVPEGFNMYNPKPGMYEIGLEFTHHVHFDGVTANLNIDGEDYPWDGELNLTDAINAYGGQLMVWTDTDTFRGVGSGWGSVMFVVGADGLVDEIYDRYTWEHTTETGTVVTDGDVFAAWQAALVIEDGGYVIAAHGSTYGTNFRDENMSYDAVVVVTMPEDDFDYDIVTTDSYMLTVDDTTAPFALAVNEEYMIMAGEYTNVDDAILANVVAFDEYNDAADLAVYVSDNGSLNLTTAGTYTVEVTVEDEAGNVATVEFDVTVVADPGYLTDAITEAEVQALIDAATENALTDTEIQALIDAAVAGQLTDADVQALIDASTPADTGCGSSLALGTSLVGIFAAMSGAGLFIIRRKK